MSGFQEGSSKDLKKKKKSSVVSETTLHRPSTRLLESNRPSPHCCHMGLYGTTDPGFILMISRISALQGIEEV